MKPDKDSRHDAGQPRKNPLQGLEKLTGNVAPKPKEMSRRQMIVGALALTGVSTVAISLYQRLDADTFRASKYLPAVAVRTIYAATRVLVGEVGTRLLDRGDWPLQENVDSLFATMSPSVREMAVQGLILFEQVSTGFSGFSSLGDAAQLRQLERWRDADNEIGPSVFGLLRTLAAVSFAQQGEAWNLMNFEGPCVASQQFMGRAPGQTAMFEWDPIVP